MALIRLLAWEPNMLAGAALKKKIKKKKKERKKRKLYITHLMGINIKLINKILAI